MSHIPASAVPHAKSHDTHEDAAKSSQAAKPGKTKALSDDAARVGREALDTIKAHPKTAIAVGATIVAGAVAAVAAPLLAKQKDAKPKKAGGAKKTKSA